MSNVLAIAAATTTLRNLLLAQLPSLDPELGDLEVTTQPPDLARKGVTKAQLNLFLYQVTHSAAWRNQDVPLRTRPGEAASPPLALNLHYLITAYGRGESDNDAISHRVLAGAMSVLYDHAMLGAGEIRTALSGNDLADQIERVRITPAPLSVEELSKLWTAFQTSYRVSATYEAAVVLIDSRSPLRAPLPVLKRGPEDRGATAVTSAAPVLEALVLPRSQSAARLGDDIVIRGLNLTPEDAVVRFMTPRLPDPVDVAPLAGEAADTLRVRLVPPAEDPGAAVRWAPGMYTLALLVRRAGLPPLLSNELLLALAPAITLGSLTATTGNLVVNVGCMPRIRDGQRVLLLFGDRVLPPQNMTNPADTSQPTALVFDVDHVAAGTYTVRLRVDGADSIPVDFSAASPTFDPNQQVVVS